MPLRIIRPIEGESFSNNDAATNYSYHAMTGVEKLHKAGITGKDATVAVIDTGVNYTHPALGGGVGDGFKVIGGLNLAGSVDHYNPNGFGKDIDGHGTHVAGIVAGKGEKYVSSHPRRPPSLSP